MQADGELDELLHRSTALRAWSALARADAVAARAATARLLVIAADLSGVTREIRDATRSQRSRRQH